MEAPPPYTEEVADEFPHQHPSRHDIRSSAAEDRFPVAFRCTCDFTSRSGSKWTATRTDYLVLSVRMPYQHFRRAINKSVEMLYGLPAGLGFISQALKMRVGTEACVGTLIDISEANHEGIFMMLRRREAKGDLPCLGIIFQQIRYEDRPHDRAGGLAEKATKRKDQETTGSLAPKRRSRFLSWVSRG